MQAQHPASSRGGVARRGRRILGGAVALGFLVAACDSAEDRMQSHYENGLKLAEAGEPVKAALEFTNALRIDDGFIPAHAALGRLERDSGQLARAAFHLERVAEARPGDLETRLDLARVHLDLRALDRAREAADAALALAPDDPRGLALRGAVDLLGGDSEAAVGRARAALEADPGMLLARLVLTAERLRSGDARAALEILEAAPEHEDAEDAAGLDLIRLRVLERTGDRAAVGAALKRLREVRPANGGVRLALARWHMQGEPPEVEAAEAELRAVAALTPEAPEARLRVVEFLRRTKGEGAARAELERLIAEAGGKGPEAARYERVLALAEARAGDRAAAAARLEALVAREGENEAGDAARLLLARLGSGPDADARREALVGQVLARDPRNAEALAMRAELAIREDRPEDAVRDLRAALEQSPQQAGLLELLAVAHERNGDATLAAERRALAVRASGAAPEPSLRHARRLMQDGKLASAESVLLDALRRAPRERRLLTALAEVRLRREDWEGARRLVETLKAAGGDEAEVIGDQLRAAALLGEGRVEETLDILREGWESRGGDLGMEALVRAYAVADAPDRAAAFLDRVLAESPENVRALALMAEVKAAAGEADAAEAALRRALAASPDDPRLHRLLAAFLRSQGLTAEADRALEAGLAAAPEDPGLRFDKAMRLEAKGDPEGAIALYERLYASYPGDLAVANNLASLLSDYRADAESLQRAAAIARRLRSSPNPAHQDTYGWTLHLGGESAQAAAVLREAAPKLPENAIAQYHLGMAYAAIGQDALAREQLIRALELAEGGSLFPQRRQAEAALARLDARAKAAGKTDG